MLLWIEGGAATVPALLSSDERRQALNNLVFAAQSGRHVLSGDRDLLVGLEKSGYFGESGSAYLARASKQLTQDGVWISQQPKLRLSVGEREVRAVADGWVVPLEFFIDPDRVDAAVLLAENIRDARYYSAFAQAYAAERMPGYAVVFHPVHGGGQQICEQLRDVYVRGRNPVFCLVDSDKSHAADNLGKVALECDALSRAHAAEGFRLRIRALDARSVENLIPRELWDHLLVGMEASHRSTIDLLCELPESVSGFVDLKRGDKLCRFYRMGVIARGQVPVLGEQCVDCGVGFECQRISPFGKGILQRAVARISEAGISSVASAWPAALRAVAHELASFGMAMARPRV